MMLKRADELVVGDVVRLGGRTGTVTRIIQESPQVLLIHIDAAGRWYVHRKRTRTIVQRMESAQRSDTKIGQPGELQQQQDED